MIGPDSGDTPPMGRDLSPAVPGRSGVMFTAEPRTGIAGIFVIRPDASYQQERGAVRSGEYRVFTASLEDTGHLPVLEGPTPDLLTADLLTKLVQLGRKIEEERGMPVGMDWTVDDAGEPNVGRVWPLRVVTDDRVREYRLLERSDVVVQGFTVAHGIAAGSVQVLDSMGDAASFRDGSILVAHRTDPHWLPIIQRASGVVTEQGSVTSHAAIASRELGIPTIVGAAAACQRMVDGDVVTIDCSQDEVGRVYRGRLKFHERILDVSALSPAKTPLMLSLASPDGALQASRLPVSGVGLLRMEFLLGQILRIHPMALVDFESIVDIGIRNAIAALTREWPTKREYFVERLARGIASIAAPFHPRPVLVRFSDLKSNEYAALIGGDEFETHEGNPAVGLRGAARYLDVRYRPAFELECEAVRRVRRDFGFTNVQPMIPFCRSPQEADRVFTVMAAQGLERGRDGLRVHGMMETPANALEADAYAKRFDGLSIGGNDLTQLTLAVDRDLPGLAKPRNADHPAVRPLIRAIVDGARQVGIGVGYCGQVDTVDGTFLRFLTRIGCDWITVEPSRIPNILATLAELDGTLD